MTSWDGTELPQTPRTNRGLVLAAGTAVLVLAVVGATAGWILAGRTNPGAAGAVNSPAPSASLTVPPTTATATATTEPPPVASPTSTGQPSNAFPLPDVTDLDFEEARRRLRELRLGVTITFGQSGADRTVSRTEPAAGRQVRRGITVKLYVRGSAPYATIPGVAGLPCNQAGAIVADHGLVPRYPTGRTGMVLRTDPEPAPDQLRWNDILRIYCAAVPPSPTP